MPPFLHLIKLCVSGFGTNDRTWTLSLCAVDKWATVALWNAHRTRAQRAYCTPTKHQTAASQLSK